MGFLRLVKRNKTRHPKPRAYNGSRVRLRLSVSHHVYVHASRVGPKAWRPQYRTLFGCDE